MTRLYENNGYLIMITRVPIGWMVVHSRRYYTPEGGALGMTSQTVVDTDHEMSLQDFVPWSITPGG